MSTVEVGTWTTLLALGEGPGKPLEAVPHGRSWCHLVGGSGKDQAGPGSHAPLVQSCASRTRALGSESKSVGLMMSRPRPPSASPDHCASKTRPQPICSPPWKLLGQAATLCHLECCGGSLTGLLASIFIFPLSILHR